MTTEITIIVVIWIAFCLYGIITMIKQSYEESQLSKEEQEKLRRRREAQEIKDRQHTRQVLNDVKRGAGMFGWAMFDEATKSLGNNRRKK